MTSIVTMVPSADVLLLCCCCSERKRKQLTELQARLAKLEATNASLSTMLAQRDHELATLRNAAHNRAPH